MSTPRPPQSLPEYLGTNAVVLGAVQIGLALVVAGLAVSRADAHVLSPAALAGIITVAAAAGVVIGWPVALYSGALDLVRGRTTAAATSTRDDGAIDDPFAPRSLWRTTLGWTAGAALWAATAAGLVAVALDGHRARLVVLLVALAGIAGAVTVALDVLARRRGVEAAARLKDVAATPYPLRRRAWLHFALPVALSQIAVNAGVAWLLFHDYVVGDAFAADALTDTVAFADLGVMVVIVCAFFGYVARQWGELDARLHRVVLDDPDVQTISSRAPIGRSVFVYLALAVVFLVGPIITAFVPAEPSLGAVMVVRGLLAGALAGAATAIAYVRGAVNAAAAALEVGR